MINQKEISAEIDRLNQIKTLIETYEEIAANRMRKNRSIVLASRLFNEGLVDMYKEIKTSYRKQLLALMHKRHVSTTQGFSLLRRNGKTVAVFLSSNAGLYGNIVQRLSDEFIKYVQSNKSDVLVIGRLGKKLFEEGLPGHPYTFFDLPDTNIESMDVEKLSNLLIGYEKIYIFYGRFESVGVQRPTVLDVVGQNIEEEEEQQNQQTNTQQVKYLFEPSLEEIMIFFEEQIFTSIIEQTLKESELAKFASRMITLDSATENVKADLKNVYLKQRLLEHREKNKKQQELLLGMSLWNK